MPDRLPQGGFAPLVPELDVRDLARSLAFWCDGLGFTCAYERPENGFAYLECEGAQVMLNAVNGNWITAPLTPPFGRGINLQIAVRSTAPILARLTALEWPLFRPLHEVWYRAGEAEVGYQQFLVQDPDGYLLRFGEASAFARSALPCGGRDAEAVEFRGDADLAAQARSRLHVGGEVEHVLLHVLGGSDDRGPFAVHIDVTGRAGAGAPALGIDARDVVADRRFHHG